MKHLFLAAACALAATLSAQAQTVVLSTTAGEIRVAVDAEKAPKSAANFLAYVKAGHYNGTIFHRVISDFMVQGGGFTPKMDQKPTKAPIPLESRNGHQTVTLLETIEANRFDCLIGGARRDEEKARAKERIFSHRDSFGQWQPKEQRPELWTLFNTRIRPGEHFRCFPISNWTELDVWLYIARENIPLPPMYYAHQRQVMRRKGLLVPLTDVTPPQDGETVETVQVRFRTVGDMTCTCPVESPARNATEVVAETLTVTVSERGATRMDDRTSEASMEKRKKEGYF